MYNMARQAVRSKASLPVHLHAKVRKVGNSLAILIPAATARQGGLEEGDEVEAELQKAPAAGLSAALGLLADLPYEPFSREGLYDDD